MKKKLYYHGKHQSKGWYEVDVSLVSYLLDSNEWSTSIGPKGARKKEGKCDKCD